MHESLKRLRFESPGDTRYITLSCYDHLPLLDATWARDIVVSQIALSRDRLGFQLFAYVVMPDHVHMLLHPNIEVSTVSRILSAIKTRTATRILERYRSNDLASLRLATTRNGEAHLWQAGGGHDRNIFSSEEFLEKATYIDDNPVRRGLTAVPEDYSWSSAGSKLLGRDEW